MQALPTKVFEPLGPTIRRQRRRLGLTLNELAGRAGISKPYLSLIETGRVANPPSDEKLRRLEQTLGFSEGELLTQAHLQRTPRDVRAVLQKLLHRNKTAAPETAGAIDLHQAFVSGMLEELAGVSSPGPRAVPVINRVAAGYPRDFTDLSYPPRVADEYVSCPDVEDRDAFAARVEDDSMMPMFGEADIVIFSPALVPRSGDDCFVRFAGGQTTFKQVFFEPADNGAAMLRLQPRNKRYTTTTVSSQSVLGLYRAVCRYHRVDGEGTG